MLVLIIQLLSLASLASSDDYSKVCLHHEHQALLAFKTAFTVNKDAEAGLCERPRAKTETWANGTDCCQWDGVTCDPSTGHVTDLNLGCSLLTGNFPTNTTFFHLRRLRSLNLSHNAFFSTIPPYLGRLSQLTYLDLSFSEFFGQVPSEIGWLSRLTTLDLSYLGVTMPNFKPIITNLSKNIQYLSLSYTYISCDLPFVITNLSEIISLQLRTCNLGGYLPATVNKTTLARLSAVDLSFNKITGVIPAWLFALPSLKSLIINENLFTGLSGSINANDSSRSSLVEIYADNNRIQGTIPEAIFELRNIRALDIESNSLNGIIPLSKLHKLQNLNILRLSDNNFSIIDDMTNIDDSISSWPRFSNLGLSSCNLGHFPRLLRQQENLNTLELSNNGIHGQVPEWLLYIGLNSLQNLDLSYNSLTGGLDHLPWRNMNYIDIRSNRLKGGVPIPTASIFYFSASNNQFTGGIPLLFCDMASLAVLSLSHNNLTGNIPRCLAYPISQKLFILDVKENQLEGVIPSVIFQQCPYLSTLTINGNLLEGPIPQSLSSCIQLQLLDLGNNKLNGTIPNWLVNLPDLEVLILGSNNLHGPLMDSSPTKPFSKLRILDVSSNDLTGELSVDLLMSFKAMSAGVDSRPWTYMYVTYYQDSIMTWVKGLSRQLDEILVDLVLIDASNNKLEGRIPDAIGGLISIRWLNIARNNITSNIPTSLANLSLLESLDLSCNRLDGQIPSELINLVSLEFFNVSQNNLSGPVPTLKQFGTFTDDSYFGNPGLCGEFLTNKCKRKDVHLNGIRSRGNDDVESSNFRQWEIMLIGFGCGMLIGSIWGYYIFWETNPYWAVKLIFKIQVFLTMKKNLNKIV